MGEIYHVQRPGNDAEIPNDDYDIAFRRCRFERSGREAVFVFTKPLSSGRFAFEDCAVVNCGTGTPEKADFHMSVTGHEGYRPNAIELKNVTIHQPQARPWLAFFGSPEKPFDGEPTRIGGTVTVKAEGRTESLALDDAWRRANTPFKACAQRSPVRRVAAPLADKEIVDACPGTSVACAPVFVQTSRFRRPCPLYCFHAEKGRQVEMTAFVLPGKKGARGRVRVCPYGSETNVVWSKALKSGEQSFRFRVPETGFYSLGLLAPNTEFGVLSTDVPMALDVTAGQVVVVGVRAPYPGYAGARLHFWIPGGTAAVTAAYYGNGSEALGARVQDPSGAISFTYPEKLGLRMARFDAAAEGLWFISLDPPRKAARESHRLSLNGVPGWYFLSAEKTWRNRK